MTAIEIEIETEIVTAIGIETEIEIVTLGVDNVLMLLKLLFVLEKSKGLGKVDVLASEKVGELVSEKDLEEDSNKEEELASEKAVKLEDVKDLEMVSNKEEK